MDENRGTFEMELHQGAQQFANDFQLGIVAERATQVMPATRRNPRSCIRSPSRRAIPADGQVGTGGSGTEGLEAAEKALRGSSFPIRALPVKRTQCIEPDLCVEGVCGGHNRGFLREEAALKSSSSDEDDSSTATLNYYVDFFKNQKGFLNEALPCTHPSAPITVSGGCDANSVAQALGKPM